MKFSLGITAGIAAASLVSTVAVAQTAPMAPPARSAQVITIQKNGGYLGIGGMEVTPERVKALNLKEERGVEVSSVEEDGPAAKAGIKSGDVVLEFNGTPVQGTVEFQRMVSEMPPGRQVKLTVWRNGATQNLTATIGERKNGMTTMVPGDSHSWAFEMPNMPAMPRMPELNMPRMEVLSPSPALGIYGEPLAETEQLAEFFGVTDGVLVRSVRKGSAAEKAGIKAGDVITKIDDERVSNSMDITRTLRAAKGKKTGFTLTIVRNKKEMPLSVTVETAGNSTRMQGLNQRIMDLQSELASARDLYTPKHPQIRKLEDRLKAMEFEYEKAQKDNQ
jgi:serine protease Do